MEILSPPIASAPPQLLSTPQLLVLNVEDDMGSSELIKYLVSRRLNLKVMSTTHGETAIHMARLHKPALILLDLNLPDFKGLDVLAILRSDPATAAIPVIGLTSEPLPTTDRKMLEAGFFGYLVKPFQFAEFHVMVDAAMAESKQLATAYS